MITKPVPALLSAPTGPPRPTARLRNLHQPCRHDRWENEIGPAVHGLLIAQDSVVTKVTPTPASPLQ